MNLEYLNNTRKNITKTKSDHCEEENMESTKKKLNKGICKPLKVISIVY